MERRDTLADFADFCGSLALENGKPMVLEPFQHTILADYFAGVRETVVLIPKKNGKTSLLAALALHHMLATDDPYVPVVAASVKQAKVMFNQARGLIARSPAIKDKFRVLNGYREIRKIDPDDPDNPKRWVGLLDVLAADEDTADGAIPTLACVDELHRQKSSGLYAVLRDGLGARDGRMLTISTAGDDLGTPLGQIRNAAHALPGLEHTDAHRYARTDDFAFHEWALEAGDDVEDFDIVKRANPASWQTPQELRRRKTPTTKPWEHARFACGIWMVGEGTAISEKEWRSCADVKAVIPGGADNVYIGVDIGRRRDCTAVVAIWRPEPGTPTRVDPVAVIEPPGDGTATPEDDIWEAFEDACERWPEATFVIDPKLGGDIFAERLEREFPHARVAVFDQVPGNLTRMARRLSDAISEQRIAHPDDERLNAHVLAAGARQVGEQWRFAKQRHKEMPIDALIALAMAFDVLIGEESKPKPSSVAHFL